MKIKTFTLTYPNKTFKPDSIEELVEQFDKQVNDFTKDKEVISVNSQVNGLVSGFQYFVTVIFI
ncbi:hypothetical protein [Macrococcus animalis]|uniref:hypothetical protein n=1 Tax=Macrococcus animalis TaxID=3395467 RepID=UPI0039BEA988